MSSNCPGSDAPKAPRLMTMDARAAFLATVTEELLPAGWQRVDQDSLGRPTTEFRRPPRLALVAVATNALRGLSARLSSNENGIPWWVTADDPDPVVIASAAHAALDDGASLCTPLADLLAADGWHCEEGDFPHGASDHRWVSRDGQRDALQLPGDGRGLGDWLISRAPTSRTARRTHYATSAYTPAAVLAAIALCGAPNS